MTYSKTLVSGIMRGDRECMRLTKVISNAPLTQEQKYEFGQKECQNIANLEKDLAEYIISVK